MPDFVVLIKGLDRERLTGFSPAQFQDLLGRHLAWREQLERGGHYVGGSKLKEETTHRLTPTGEQVVVDGPFIETKEAIGGFYRVRASSISQAIELARGCPSLAHGC